MATPNKKVDEIRGSKSKEIEPIELSEDKETKTKKEGKVAKKGGREKPTTKKEELVDKDANNGDTPTKGIHHITLE